MTTLMTWLSNFLVGLLTPLIEKLVANTTMASRLSSVEEKQTAIIKANGELQAAQTPEEMQNAIKDIAAADNLNSK